MSGLIEPHNFWSCAHVVTSGLGIWLKTTFEVVRFLELYIQDPEFVFQVWTIYRRYCSFVAWLSILTTYITYTRYVFTEPYIERNTSFPMKILD